MTIDRFPWFKCFPSKWLGALGAMKQDEWCLYVIVCFRMYEIGGPCRDSLEALALRSHMNKRRVSEILDRLFRTGKLVRDGDGIINKFAAELIETRACVLERRAQAGRIGGLAKAEKTEENQQSDSSKCHPNAIANGWQEPRDLELDLDIESKKERKSTRASRAPTRFPEDWIAPDEAAIAYGKKHHWNYELIVAEFSRFRRNHIGKGTRWVRWDLAWHTWVDNEIKWYPQKRFNGDSNKARGGFAAIAMSLQQKEDDNVADDDAGFVSG